MLDKKGGGISCDVAAFSRNVEGGCAETEDERCKRRLGKWRRNYPKSVSRVLSNTHPC